MNEEISKEGYDLDLIKKKIDFFMNNGIMVHVRLKNKSFINGIFIKQYGEDIYVFREQIRDEIYLFVDEIYDITNFIEKN